MQRSVWRTDEWIKDVEEGFGELRNRDTVVNDSVELELQKRSIYRVPKNVAGTAQEHYVPQLVSLGPYHYLDQGDNSTYCHSEDYYKMEEHKRRVLCFFLKRSGTQLCSLLQAFDREWEYLQEAYDLKEYHQWEYRKNFLMLMIQDGCFILEVLSAYSKNNHYNSNDPVFGTRGIINVLPQIKRDMLMLENQVPFAVIRMLFAVAKGQVNYNPDEIPDELLNLVLRFFSVSTASSSLKRKICKRPCLHLLDICREIMIYDPLSPKRRTKPAHASTNADTIHLPSASDLYEAGIIFERSSSMHLNDISFSWSTLKIPPITISPDTVTMFANLLAFERVHPVVHEVTSYVIFMNCLIQDVNDVRLLKTSEIMRIISFDDEYVVGFLRSLCKDAHLLPTDKLGQVYKVVSQQVRIRIRRKLNKLWVDLLKTYFRTPLGVISVIAAIVLFTLTILQTLYSILSYVDRKD